MSGRCSIILVITDPQDGYVDADFIQTAVQSLSRLRGKHELVLVNNNPLERCPKMSGYLRDVAGTRSATVLVECDANLGSSGAFNVGAKVASDRSDYVIFMSEDAEVMDPDVLAKFEEALDANSQLGVIHPVSIFEDADRFNVADRLGMREFYRRLALLGSRQRTLEQLNPSRQDLERIACHINRRPMSLVGPQPTMPLTFTAIRRKIFDLLQGFDEKLFFCHENNDFTLRAMMAGFYVARLNSSFVNHRRLVIRGIRMKQAAPYDPAPNIQMTQAHWDRKWGKSANHIFGELRYGRRMYWLLLPALKLRNRSQELATKIRWRFEAI